MNMRSPWLQFLNCQYAAAEGATAHLAGEERMLEVFRKYVDSLAGVTELRREQAERLVQDLQKRGELRARDLQKAAQDLVDRSLRNRQELLRLIRKEMRRQIHTLGLATQDDLDKLSRRIKALEDKQRSAPKRSTRSGTKSKSKSASSAKSKSASSSTSKSTSSAEPNDPADS
jgi:polyhydroxyalkanoate synthesis regulator phasin